MKIFIFDLGGVLINLKVSRCMAAFEALMGEASMRAVFGMDSRGEGVKAVSVATKQLMYEFERGLISEENFVKEILPYCYPGTTEQAVVDAGMAMLDDLPAERLDFIDRLRANGHPIYLLSNGNDLHFNHINRLYGLEKHFDRMFLSQEMHLAKPSKEIYTAVNASIRKEHNNGEEIIFIDDIEINRKAATQSVGWKTCQGIDDLLDKQHMSLTKRFHKACADYALIEDGDHILIGLSGGKDSLALVELLGKRAQIYKPKFHVTALHVRIKERSYQTDLSYLESFCKECKVPLIVKEVEIVGGDGENTNPCFLCSWYRRKALFNMAQELGCNKIAFGHHRDDIVQTLLMNLFYQGALATMPPKLQLEKMPLQIIRPLCLIDEEDIATYAAMRDYHKQSKLCPFEHVSSREKVKGLMAQIKAMNPEVMDSVYAAMSNIKAEYLPPKI